MIMEELENLIAELEQVKTMPEDRVMREYNVDSKQEAIEALEAEIRCAKASAPEEFDYTEEELEAERQALCMSQGISRY